MAHILIVEDDDLLRDGLCAQLGQAGHTVISARDGREAQQHLEAQRFDGVVLDLGLPVIDGLSVLRWIRQRLAALPVLLLTARDDHIASHAWVDVWLARHERWFSIDVTNGVPGGLQHCRLAVGRDYLDACPVRGVRRGGGAETMSAKVEVSGDGEIRRQGAPRPRLLQQHAAQQ